LFEAGSISNLSIFFKFDIDTVVLAAIKQNSRLSTVTYTGRGCSKKCFLLTQSFSVYLETTAVESSLARLEAVGSLRRTSPKIPFSMSSRFVRRLPKSYGKLLDLPVYQVPNETRGKRSNSETYIA